MEFRRVLFRSRERAPSAQRFADHAAHVLAIVGTDDRFEGPYVLLHELARRVAGEHLYVITDKAHRPRFDTLSAVHGARDVDDKRPELLLAPALGRLGGGR